MILEEIGEVGKEKGGRVKDGEEGVGFHGILIWPSFFSFVPWRSFRPVSGQPLVFFCVLVTSLSGSGLFAATSDQSSNVYKIASPYPFRS